MPTQSKTAGHTPSPGRVAAGKALAARRAQQRAAAMEAGALGGAAGSDTITVTKTPGKTVTKIHKKVSVTKGSGAKGGAAGTSAVQTNSGQTTGKTGAPSRAPMGIIETDFSANWSQEMLVTAGYLDQGARLLNQSVIQASEGHLTLAEQYRLSAINFAGQAWSRLYGEYYRCCPVAHPLFGAGPCRRIGGSVGDYFTPWSASFRVRTACRNASSFR